MKKVLFLLTIFFVVLVFKIPVLAAGEGCNCLILMDKTYEDGKVCSVQAHHTFPIGSLFDFKFVADPENPDLTKDCKLEELNSTLQMNKEDLKVTKEVCDGTIVLTGTDTRGYKISLDCNMVSAGSTATTDKSSVKKPANTSASTDLLSGVTGISDLNPLGAISPEEAFARVIKLMMGLMGMIALVLFIYGGVLWMLAGGNAENQKKSVQIMVWTTLGMMIIFASWAVVRFVFEAFSG